MSVVASETPLSALVDALTAGDRVRADAWLGAVEDEAAQALSAADVQRIVSVAGRLSRARRRAEAVAPDWDGLALMGTLGTALRAGVTGLQLALRRAAPTPIPDTVAAVTAPRPTVRERVLDALDEQPRRPADVAVRAGVGRRQVLRALAELVESGAAEPAVGVAEDRRARFYRRAD